MVDSSQVARSKSIHRRTGRTFYVATRLLPARVRRPTYVLYAFFRIADEVVDDEDNDLTPGEQRERLEAIRAAALGREPTDDPVLAAFSELREREGIADADVEEFVDAMLTDVEKTRYDTYEELEAYMGGSAGAVGEMMTALMDPADPERARRHARRLGEAFQLTNFLRDVREDVVERGRVYLPGTTLSAHGVTPELIARLEADEGVRNAVRDELRRAEGLYREGVAGIEYLPRDCQFPVLLAAVLYADHHRLIRERDCDVLSVTPQLSTVRKLWLVARTRLHWVRWKDPGRVFGRVSAVPTGADRRRERGAGDPSPAR